MKKQFLFLISGLLISNASYSMEANSKAKEATSEPTVDPMTILHQFADHSETIKKYIEIGSSHSRLGNMSSLPSVVNALQGPANVLYCYYLVESRKAKLCINSPECNILVAKTKRILAGLEAKQQLSDPEIAFQDTLTGLLQTLKDAKENANKN